MAEDSTTEFSKPAETQTQERALPAEEGGKAPDQVKTEEAAKATEDPLKPSAEQNGPKNLPVRFSVEFDNMNCCRSLVSFSDFLFFVLPGQKYTVCL